MSVKLNDTQLILLSAASQREDHYLTLPSGARLAPARKAANKLLAAGLVREVRARKDAPIWRHEEETERAFALKLAAAGMKAIIADTEDSVDTPRPEPSADEVETTPTSSAHQAVDGEQSPELDAPAASPVAPRSGTKIDDVVKMLSRPEGATIDAIVTATGWLPHTTRAALTGLRKRGYAIGRSLRGDGGPSVYRLTRPSQPGV
jgi:Protein of unknown function (DUF3489)